LVQAFVVDAPSAQAAADLVVNGEKLTLAIVSKQQTAESVKALKHYLSHLSDGQWRTVVRTSVLAGRDTAEDILEARVNARGVGGTQDPDALALAIFTWVGGNRPVKPTADAIEDQDP
jgi:hypothetical protein